MSRALLLLMVLTLLVGNLPPTYGQQIKPPPPPGKETKTPLDVATREKIWHDQKQLLKQSVKKGWSPDQVRRIMGDPERVESFRDGAGLHEIWGYEGMEVRVEFVNGVVSDWFLRFMQGKKDKGKKE